MLLEAYHAKFIFVMTKNMAVSSDLLVGLVFGLALYIWWHKNANHTEALGKGLNTSQAASKAN